MAVMQGLAVILLFVVVLSAMLTPIRAVLAAFHKARCKGLE